MEDSDQGWFSEDTATFGDRVAGAREAAGLDQEALARKLGIKVSTLRNWENDLNEPRANKLQMLSGVLGVSLRWLLTAEGQGLSSPYEGEIDEDADKILSQIRQLHSQITHASEKIGVLEKRLRAKLTS